MLCSCTHLNRFSMAQVQNRSGELGRESWKAEGALDFCPSERGLRKSPGARFHGKQSLHQLWKQKMVLKINQLVFHSVQKVYSRSYGFNLQPNLLPTLLGLLLLDKLGIIIPFTEIVSPWKTSQRDPGQILS